MILAQRIKRCGLSIIVETILKFSWHLRGRECEFKMVRFRFSVFGLKVPTPTRKRETKLDLR